MIEIGTIASRVDCRVIARRSWKSKECCRLPSYCESSERGALDSPASLALAHSHSRPRAARCELERCCTNVPIHGTRAIYIAGAGQAILRASCLTRSRQAQSIQSNEYASNTSEQAALAASTSRHPQEIGNVYFARQDTTHDHLGFESKARSTPSQTDVRRLGGHLRRLSSGSQVFLSAYTGAVTFAGHCGCIFAHIRLVLRDPPSLGRD